MIARILPIVFTIPTLLFTMGAESWKAPDLTSVDDLRLTGVWGAAQAHSAQRLASEPLDRTDFILADVTQKVKRRFIEYSGDLSGRWISAAAFLAPLYPRSFAAFPTILAGILDCQKSDGHFGVDQQLPTIERQRDMPIVWGNGRLLIALVDVYERTGDPKALEAAKKLGDYFVATDSVYDKAENLRAVGGTYAEGFATCYFSCIESLVALGRVTKDPRYLDEAKRIAALALTVGNFDGLHCHGRLCAVRGFADLYAATGDPRWLAGAERDWKTFMDRYRLPTAGVKEVLDKVCIRDEGCAECDWLRLNLSLWRVTGQGRYLDEAEACLKNHFIYQQFPNGGAGCRLFHQIDGQPVAFKGLSEEAWFCCAEYWPLATADVARFAVTGSQQGPSINLAIECEGTVAGPGGKWKIAQRETDGSLHVTLHSPAAVKATVRIHRPAWARDGARVDKPAALSLTETEDTWLIDGTWDGSQEIAVHFPTALRRESAPGNAGVLRRGYDLLAAHPTPANAWLLHPMAKARPVVLWAAALPVKDGHITVPASLTADADPKRPEQWHVLELAPLRALTGQPHKVAWFSFQLRAATPDQIKALVAQIR